MRKILLSFIFYCLLGNANAQDAGAWSNPLDVQFGDPYILRTSNGKYYMYGTGAGAENGFVAYSSGDLINWKREGQVYYGNNKNGWGEHSYWAPEVYERNRKYYLFYSAQWKVNPGKDLENFKIGVAEADNPTGPFIDIQNKPVFNPDYPIIDANVFFAEDGRTYLYYSRCCYKHSVESEVATWARKKGWFNEVEESWVYGVEMKPDFSGVIGEPVLLLRPPVKMNDPQADWESRSVTSKEVNRRWTEGSCIFKNGDTYYMMYSANYFGGKNYAVGYATSKSPLGPFKKAANNPVLQKNTAAGGIVTGTGHNSVTYAPDGKTMLCVYHGRTSKTGDERVVFIDKMKVRDGVLTVEGPTTGKQQLAATGNRYWQTLHYFMMMANTIYTEQLERIRTAVSRHIVQLVPWEDTQNVSWKVTEGPTIIKQKGWYYMIYSANDFRNPDYAIGYATAKSPAGPWTKSNTSSIISRKNIGLNGTGHGDVLWEKNGKIWYVFHVHADDAKVSPRKTAIVELQFKKNIGKADELYALPKTFRLLNE